MSDESESVLERVKAHIISVDEARALLLGDVPSYTDLLNERNAAVAQAAELRARWQAIPWRAIAKVCEWADCDEFVLDFADDEGEIVEAWLSANMPREESNA